MMKNICFVLVLAAIAYVFTECEFGMSPEPGITIVKYKNPEYNNYASVAKKDSLVVASPGETSHMVDTTGKYCVRLHQDYFVGECCLGVILKIPKKDWPDFFWERDTDSLWQADWTQYILDDDPFLEIYHDEKRNFGIWDSIRLNEIIDNGELEKYFIRMK